MLFVTHQTKKNGNPIIFGISVLFVKAVLSVQSLQAEYQTQGPGVLDFGAVAILEELARAVTAVYAEIIPGESAHEVEVDLVLLETFGLLIIFNLVHLEVVIHAGIGVPVQDAGNTQFQFLDNPLLEHQRELNRPHVQVGRAVLDFLNVL